MTAADSSEENDLLFRILIAGEEPNESSSPPGEEGLSEAAAEQLANLKDSLESIRIASSAGSSYVDGQPGVDGIPIEHCLSARFEMIRRLGSGGFGVVVLARDKQLQCNVALKMPRPDILLTKTLVRRFLREAQNVAKLSHPNIVPMLGTDDTSEIPTIVYYYCDGPTLSQWIALQSNPVSAQVAAQIGLLLSEGVLHAHSRGVLHRDLKPSNVLLEKSVEGNIVNGFRDGETVWFPRITDFGISKVLAETEGPTQDGMVMGTLEYMPPEQISGRTGDIGTHSDIYSLGVILYELLVGKVPFTSNEASARGHQSIEDNDAPSVRKVRPDIPRDLDAILQKCMSASEKDRYNTAAELIRELKAFLTNRPVMARPIGSFVRLQKWVRRQPVAASLAAACTVMIALGFTAIIVGDQRTRAINEQLGTTNEHLAQAVLEADRERDLAKQSARDLRLQSYCEDLTSANRALNEGDVSRCDFLLRRQMELSQGKDLRDSAWHYLWEKGHRPFTRIQVSKSPLYSIRFSSDGALIAICGADGWVRILDAYSKTKVMEWYAEQSELNCATFSMDGQYLATAGDDGTICVWELANQKCTSRFRAHPEAAFNATFASQDTMFTCGNEPTIRAWNWRTGEALGVLERHTRGVQSIILSTDRATLYSASDDLTWCSWNATTFELVSQSNFTGARKVDIQPSPSGSTVFVADSDGIVTCESTIGNSRQAGLIVDLPDSVGSISLSSKGRRLAIASREGSVRIVDIDEKGNPKKAEDNGSSNIWASRNARIHDIVFSPDDVQLHAVDEEGMWTIWKSSNDLTIWNLNLSPQFPEVENTNIAMDQVTPDVCVFALEHRLYSWNTLTDQVEPLVEFDNGVSRIVAHEPKGLILTGHVNGLVQAWNYSSRSVRPLWEYRISNPIVDIGGIAYSIALDQVAVSAQSAGSTVRILDANNGLEIRRLSIPGIETGENGPMVFSADGKWLACAVENKIVLWDLHSGQFRLCLGHDSTITSLCFHPGNETLVSGGEDRSLRLWNIRTGKPFSELRHHKERVLSILISLDGNQILSTDSSGRTAIWHMAAMKYLFELGPLDGEAMLAENWIGPKLFRRGRSIIRAELLGGR